MATVREPDSNALATQPHSLAQSAAPLLPGAAYGNPTDLMSAGPDTVAFGAAARYEAGWLTRWSGLLELLHCSAQNH